MKRITLFVTICALPSVAAWKFSRSFDWRILVTIFLTVSLITYVAYWQDKRRARANGWRIPEKLLHFLELAGGWPTAFIAQQQFRHKTTKRKYRIIYWSIVAFYQYLAINILMDADG